MITFRQIARLIHINRVLVRNGLDEIILATHLFRPIRFLLHLLPWHWFGSEKRPRAERIRCALEELGPIFIKFGQMLSTRPDLLPPDIAKELALLQDRVPPFSGTLAKQLIEEAMKKPVSELFAEFDERPLASASIAQVHPAKLPNGESVVVKVVRPDIAPVIKRDIELLKIIAELAERYWKEGKRLRPREIVAEYEKTITDELDLMREAASASQLRRNFLNSPMLYIPEVYWDYCRPNVMVMERIHGIPISDVAELRKQNVDLIRLSERGVEIFFTQVFKHNFFHADMHPGNIFVAPNGQYIAVDFGIVGTLNEDDQRYLAENFVAFFNRDYRRVAELHVQSGWVPSGTRVNEFESAIRTVCEPIFERPLKDISFGQLLLRLFQTARRFNMEVQPQLVLLQKTLLNIEGLGRELNPDLDLWRTAKPFLESWMRDRAGPKALWRNIRQSWPSWVERAGQLPDLIFDALAAQKNAGSTREYEFDIIQRRVARESRLNYRRYYLLAVGALLMVSAYNVNDFAIMTGMNAFYPYGSLVLLLGSLWFIWIARPLGTNR